MQLTYDALKAVGFDEARMEALDASGNRSRELLMRPKTSRACSSLGRSCSGSLRRQLGLAVPRKVWSVRGVYVGNDVSFRGFRV